MQLSRGTQATATADPIHPRCATRQRPRILHITGDYPNIHKPLNTLAVKNFIDANPFADHVIVTIDRTARPWRYRVSSHEGGVEPRIFSIRYWGMPLGLQLASSMYLLARQVWTILKKNGIEFDVIHAHKLAFEGLAAYWISKWSDKPFVCSLRGEVEKKVLQAKPHYAPIYRRVLDRASYLYYVSAWYKPELRKYCRIDPAKERLLPNFVQLQSITPLTAWERSRYVSILCFDVYKRKGLDRLLPAFRQALEHAPDIRLDLIGRGSPARLQHVQSLIDSLGLSKWVRLIGPMEHERLLGALGQYAGLLLPSRNETFGMSYIEALLSSVPILYSKASGVDGFLDGVESAVGVDPYSVPDIAAGILKMESYQARHRAWLRENHAAILQRFSPDQYIEKYNEDIKTLSPQYIVEL